MREKPLLRTITKTTNKMKLQIFILDDNDDRVIIDRRYAIIEGNAPEINLQEIVNDAISYTTVNSEDEINLEAKRLIQQDKAES